MRIRWRPVVLVAVLIGGGVGGWVWYRGTPAPPAAPHDGATAAVRAAASPSSSTTATPAPLSQSVPAAALDAQAVARVAQRLREGSLQGTEADGGITLDARGALVLDLDLRRWLDYHLALIGEVSPAEIRAWIADWLTQHHQDPVRAAVLAVFDRYVQYLAAIDQAAAQLDTADAAQRLALLRQLRRHWLGPDLAEAFFAVEEAYGEFRLAEARLRNDPQLSPEERQTRRAALIAALPAEARQPLREHQQTLADVDLEQRIQASGMDPAARLQARTEAFGAAAAERLQQAEAEQQQWRAQLAADQAERQRLAGLAGMDAAARAVALAQWRASHLSETERQRIEALEAIGQLPGP